MPTLDTTQKRTPSSQTEIKGNNNSGLSSNTVKSNRINLDRVREEQSRRSIEEAQDQYDTASIHQKVRAQTATEQHHTQPTPTHSVNASAGTSQDKKPTKAQEQRNLELTARNVGRNLGSEKEALKAIDSALAKTNLTEKEKKAAREKALEAFRETYKTTKQDLPWYKRVGNCVAHPVRSCQKAAEFTSKVYHHPVTQMAVGYVKKEASELATKAKEGINYAVHHPVKAAIAVQKASWEVTKKVVQAAPGFLKSMSDGIGLTQCASGVWSGIKGSAQLAYGCVTFNKDMIKQGLGNMKNSADAVIGAVRVAAELTGVADLYYMGKYALEGRWGMVAMHAGFALMSAGSIAATIATGGAACGTMLAVAAGRSTLKAAAKTALKTGAKEVIKSVEKGLCKEVTETISKRITTEAAQAVAREAGTHVAKEVSKCVTEKGAREALESFAKELPKEQAEKMLAVQNKKLTEDIAKYGEEKALESFRSRFTRRLSGFRGYEAAKKLLDEADAEKVIADSTKRALGFVHDKKEFLKYAQETMGLSKKEAKQTFKEFKSGVLKGKSDDEIVEILGKRVKENLTDMLVHEKGMGEAFEKSLREGFEKEGKIAKKEVDKLVKEGTQSFKNGIERAVHETVERGIKLGLKELRHFKIAKRLRGNSDSAEGEFSAKESEKELLEKEAKAEKKAEKINQINQEKEIRRVVTNTREENGKRITETKTIVNGEVVDTKVSMEDIITRIAETKKMTETTPSVKKKIDNYATTQSKKEKKPTTSA